MDPKERHQRISELFLGASEVAEPDRAAWLERNAGADESLKAAVRSMLAADAQPALIDPPALGQGFHAPTPNALGVENAREEGPLPERIGPFVVKGVLGRGGMGVVYLAEQERPHRRVAVKVLRATAVSASSLRRFELEAEVLGRLEHPGIARVYEAGTHAAGAEALPYFAMELVEGLPITRYGAEQKLDTRARLELFAAVCDAVQHAHAKGVVHRDLKPGNILVDGSGQPKILDFGVARLTDSDIKSTMQTEVRQIVGTLPYMSPEQAGGDSRDVDTRADVYSLGVVLYELLAGKPPFDMTGRMVHEAIRVIREEEPSKLSAVSRVFRGDLETITAKALEKDRGRRYQTAADLASDVRRNLASEPITARARSARYEIERFVSRHRGSIWYVAAAGVIVVGAVGVAVATWAGRERDRIQSAATEKAQRVERELDQARVSAAYTRFMTTIFELVERHKKADTQITPDQVLEVASGIMEERLFPFEPGKAADLHRDFGNKLYALGFSAAAARHFGRTLQLASEAGMTDVEQLDRIKNMLGISLLDSDQAALAEPILNEVVESLAKRWGGSRVEAVALDSLAKARVEIGNYGGAATALQRALELRRSYTPPPSLPVVLVLNALGEVERKAGDLDAAAATLNEALGYCYALEQSDPGVSQTTLRYLSRVARDAGRLDEAERLVRLALATSLDKPRGRGEIPSAQIDLGRILREKGDRVGAEAQFRDALEYARRPMSPLKNRIMPLQRLIELLEDDPERSGEVQKLREELEGTRRRVASPAIEVSEPKR